MQVHVDVADFLDLLGRQKGNGGTAENGASFTVHAVYTAGEFLPALSGEDWVIINSVRYKERYGEALSGL